MEYQTSSKRNKRFEYVWKMIGQIINQALVIEM